MLAILFYNTLLSLSLACVVVKTLGLERRDEVDTSIPTRLHALGTGHDTDIPTGGK